MYPGYSAKFAVAALSSDNSFKVGVQTDLEFHMNQRLAQRAAARARRLPWYLRLLPQALRQPIEARLQSHRLTRHLIEMWEISPHLLEDAGFVLSADADLPPHLVAAPKEVIAYVGAIAPWQIVQAEEAYPPRRKIVPDGKGTAQAAVLMPTRAAKA